MPLTDARPQWCRSSGLAHPLPFTAYRTGSVRAGSVPAGLRSMPIAARSSADPPGFMGAATGASQHESPLEVGSSTGAIPHRSVASKQVWQ
jgi:hypothetical protein